MEAVQVSVIVPVYNSAQYLSECLESVLSQSFKNFEVICINDGSTDNSLEILKQFQNKDSRIKIIDQENQGVSTARNAGLKIAQGKYVGFVDSDDTIEKDFFGKLYDTAERNNADAVYSKISSIKVFPFKHEVLKGGDITKELIPLFLREDGLNSVCNKIFLNRTIQNHQISFPVGIKHGEDAQFNIHFLVHANSISFLEYCGYHYREVDGSATRNIIKHDYLQRIIEVYQTDWSEIIGDVISFKELEKLKKIRLINSVISLVYIYGNKGNEFTDSKRFSKLKQIVKNNTIVSVFSDPKIKGELCLGRYSNAIFENIRKQNIFLLYLLTQYSYYRNQ
jgi:glycosyltransferase involved in cell wall biosynthesis